MDETYLRAHACHDLGSKRLARGTPISTLWGADMLPSRVSPLSLSFVVKLMLSTTGPPITATHFRVSYKFPGTHHHVEFAPPLHIPRPQRTSPAGVPAVRVAAGMIIIRTRNDLPSRQTRMWTREPKCKTCAGSACARKLAITQRHRDHYQKPYWPHDR